MITCLTPILFFILCLFVCLAWYARWGLPLQVTWRFDYLSSSHSLFVTTLKRNTHWVSSSGCFFFLSADLVQELLLRCCLNQGTVCIATCADHCWLHLCDRSSPAQPISIPKVQSSKKAHKPLRTSCISSKNVSAMFDNHTILLFWLQNKQTFHMFSLRDLRFLRCSRDLDELRAQRIIGFFKSEFPTIQRARY